jgi:hypothetical protein
MHELRQRNCLIRTPTWEKTRGNGMLLLIALDSLPHTLDTIVNLTTSNLSSI